MYSPALGPRREIGQCGVTGVPTRLVGAEPVCENTLAAWEGRSLRLDRTDTYKSGVIQKFCPAEKGFSPIYVW